MDTINKIVNKLQQKGIEQKALTDYLGLKKQVFSEWKSGRNKSYTRYISEIATSLGVSTDYLLGNEQKIQK